MLDFVNAAWAAMLKVLSVDLLYLAWPFAFSRALDSTNCFKSVAVQLLNHIVTTTLSKNFRVMVKSRAPGSYVDIVMLLPTAIVKSCHTGTTLGSGSTLA